MSLPSIKELFKGIMTNVTNVAKDVTEAHHRINLLIERIAVIEHYVGLRNQHSKETPQPHYFRQIKYDINTKTPATSLTYKSKKG